MSTVHDFLRGKGVLDPNTLRLQLVPRALDLRLEKRKTEDRWGGWGENNGLEKDGLMWI